MRAARVNWRGGALRARYRGRSVAVATRAVGCAALQLASILPSWKNPLEVKPRRLSCSRALVVLPASSYCLSSILSLRTFTFARLHAAHHCPSLSCFSSRGWPAASE